MEARAQLGVSSTTGAVTGPIGAFPIQTPVEPTGEYAVQANTLTATITFHRHGHRHARQEPALRLRMPPNDGSLVDANILGKIVLASTGNTRQDDKPIEHIGMGGQGVLPIPLVYNGWVQNVPTGVIAHAFEFVLASGPFGSCSVSGHGSADCHGCACERAVDVGVVEAGWR